jgi:hypothetical protein
MLYQIFAKSRETGNYLEEPFYLNVPEDTADAAFELADKLFSNFLQIKSVYGEGEFIFSNGTPPPYQRHDAVADSIDWTVAS